ncbi:kinetochore-associated protein DSN1 homolog [Nelusetta ayraudi]|uniref:kinetochore-associated protein DSN1 homolog n=1 Tax=Nelusetta ayraudi TaxID=303726 RepID=UPI003F705688
MAEKQSEDGRDGFDNVSGGQSKVKSVKQAAKRCSSSNPSAAPPPKSPHSDVPSPTAFTSDAGDGRPVEDKPDLPLDDTDGPPAPPVSPATRRKSWRRATLTRRSLPSLPNQHETLCRNIDTSLSDQERLDKLIEASMKFAIERTKSSLQSVPNVSLESFQKQVEKMQKEWACQAINMKTGLPAREAYSGKPANAAMENVRKSINRHDLFYDCIAQSQSIYTHNSKWII